MFDKETPQSSSLLSSSTRGRSVPSTVFWVNRGHRRRLPLCLPSLLSYSGLSRSFSLCTYVRPRKSLKSKSRLPSSSTRGRSVPSTAFWTKVLGTGGICRCPARYVPPCLSRRGLSITTAHRVSSNFFANSRPRACGKSFFAHKKIALMRA